MSNTSPSFFTADTGFIWPTGDETYGRWADLILAEEGEFYTVGVFG
jgi:hypothetical protein